MSLLIALMSQQEQLPRPPLSPSSSYSPSTCERRITLKEDKVLVVPTATTATAGQFLISSLQTSR